MNIYFSLGIIVIACMICGIFTTGPRNRGESVVKWIFRMVLKTGACAGLALVAFCQGMDIKEETFLAPLNKQRDVYCACVHDKKKMRQIYTQWGNEVSDPAPAQMCEPERSRFNMLHDRLRAVADHMIEEELLAPEKKEQMLRCE